MSQTAPDPDAPLRALVVSRIHAPEPAAASLRLAALERDLVRRGFDVTVLTTTPGPGSGPPVDDPGVDVRRWPALRNRDGYVRGYLPYLSFDLPAFGRVVAARRPDVVVVEPPPTTGWAARIASWVRGIPCVYYAADIWSVAAEQTDAPGLVTRVLGVGERAAWRRADAVLTVYPALADRLRDLEPAADIRLVGHGADTAVFRPDGATAGERRPYVVYAGTASEVHGAGVFVAAMHRVLAEIPDARLVVIGQGEDRPAMEAAAARLPPDATLFLPRLDPATTAQWIRGARASLASVRPGPYGFALATKLYAAAACGTPVVYAGGGEGRELVVHHDLGVAVDHEEAAVAAAMLAALRHPVDAATRDRLAAWAREHASLDAAARRAGDVVEELARAGRVPGGRRRWDSMSLLRDTRPGTRRRQR